MIAMTPDTPQASPRPVGNLLALVALGLLVALGIARPLLYGASVGEVGSLWLFQVFWVLLPGWLVWRGVRPENDDLVAQLALGWALGQALVICVYVTLRTLQVEGVFAWWPLIALPLALGVRWRAARGELPARVDPGFDGRSLLCLLALLVLVVLRSRMVAVGAWWRDLEYDNLVHEGNTVSLLRGLPYEDARIAELGFNYHFFSYTNAAGLREVFGVPVATALERLLTPVGPLQLALIVFVLGRSFARSTWAGLAAAALVMLHADPGLNLLRLIGPRANDFDLHSYLEYGIYRSPSMVLGLVFFATIAFLCLHVARAGLRLPTGLALALLATASAGTKGTIAPVALSASGVMLLVAWVTRKPSGPALKTLLVLSLPALPMTVLLALGGGSHASAMFRVSPWHAWQSSGAFAALARLCGWSAAEAPRWLEWVTAPVWIVLLFGPCLVAALLWLRARRVGRDDRQGPPGWLIAAALTGCALGFPLAAPGVTELFFVYNAHIALAVLGAAWFATVAAPRAQKFLVLGLLGALPAAGLALDLAAQARRDLRPKIAESAELAQYRAGLAWIREHVPLRAVVLTSAPEMLVSAYGERQTLYETERATPAFFHAAWQRIGGRWHPATTAPPQYPERHLLRERFRAEPSTELALQARSLLEQDHELYAVVDRLTLSHEGEIGTHWEVEPVGERRLQGPAAELLFENDALRVYRIGRTETR